MQPDHAPSFDPISEAKRQWRQHGWDVPEHMAAATAVMRVQQIVLGAADGALAPFGLTFSRYEALTLLYFSRHGTLPLGKIGERLMVHHTSATNTIDQLERAGLVQRVPDPSDRRRVLAAITADGRRLVESATPALTEARFGLGSLNRTDVRKLAELLTRARVGIDLEG